MRRQKKAKANIAAQANFVREDSGEEQVPEDCGVFFLSDAIFRDQTLTSSDGTKMRKSMGFEDGEELVEIDAYISVAAALKTPQRPLWVTALTKEETKVKGFETFGPPLSAEEAREVKKQGHQVLPIALLLSVKRDGTHKCRAVVLGNREIDTGAETYSSVVAAPGNRYLLADTAACGDFLVLFDLDNAFLNAEVLELVYCRLPEQWRESGESGIRRLLRALYGLRRSPRAWNKKYAARLRALGWTESVHIEGLWRKPSLAMPSRFLRLSVYVDDNACSGPVKNELDSEVNKILVEFPGRVISPFCQTESDGTVTEKHDILGSDVSYNRTRRTLLISMPKYIEKMCLKYDEDWTKQRQAGNAKTVLSPAFKESRLSEGKIVDFHVRGALGALQWAATTCRPDITTPVSVLARYTGKPVTSQLIAAIRTVFRYVFCTKDEGLSWSPQEEEDFKSTYSKLLSSGSKFADKQSFSDASFAGCFVTLKSTSGGIIYWRSFPIAWRSKRQTIRAYSTSESEYIAASDVIVLSLENRFLSFFSHRLAGTDGWFDANDGDEEDDETIWVDNTSAIAVAKSDETRPKSRHYALRWFRVKEHAKKICFCPTGLMRADALTKVEASLSQRRLLLHGYEPDWEEPVGAQDQGGDDPEEEVEVHFVRVYAGDSVGFWIL